MNRTPTFQEAVTYFLGRHLPSLGVSRNTILAYRDTLKIMLRYASTVQGISPSKMSMSKFTVTFVTGFLDWLCSEKKCSSRTRNQRLACIHSLCRYIELESPETLSEVSRILTVRNKRETHRLVPYLSEHEMKLMLASPRTSTKIGRRDLALMTLLYDSGARVQELADIRIKDIRLESPALVVLHGKGDKYREVPLMHGTCDILRRYLVERAHDVSGTTPDAYLFTSQRGDKVTRWGVTHVIRKYETELRKKGTMKLRFPVTPHVFRHTKAMHALKAGVPLIYIRDLLGHCSVSTTEIYARADVEAKRKALEKVFVDIDEQKIPDWHEDKSLMNWLENL